MGSLFHCLFAFLPFPPCSLIGSSLILYLCFLSPLLLMLSDHISALCLRERVHPLYKKIDGAVISSKSENNLDCTITFQTDTILQKFMLRFEKLALDCNDHLYIYDGAHTHGNHKVSSKITHNWQYTQIHTTEHELKAR